LVNETLSAPAVCLALVVTRAIPITVGSIETALTNVCGCHLSLYE